MDERRAVEALQRQLASNFQRVLVHENLAGRPGVRAEMERRFGFVPVLNEIDMILVGSGPILCAVEVKCFSFSNGRFNRPFYDGIGQSLSLLRYGFDHVALWHLFSDDIDASRLDRYGAASWTFIRDQLRLPLEFTYFKVADDPEKPRFTVMQYQGPNTGAALSPLDSSHFVVTWKHRNPYAGTEEARTFRAVIENELGISRSAESMR